MLFDQIKECYKDFLNIRNKAELKFVSRQLKADFSNPF